MTHPSLSLISHNFELNPRVSRKQPCVAETDNPIQLTELVGKPAATHRTHKLKDDMGGWRWRRGVGGGVVVVVVVVMVVDGS